MSGENTRELSLLLTSGAAEAARSTEGVAFLRPGLADVVRGAARLGPPSASGVRVRYETERGHWHIQVQLVTAPGHRAVDVTRAVRSAVEARVAAALVPARMDPARQDEAEDGREASASVSVTVTVTGVS
ncbi:Asp23/Gls24 family envelope stress response protein [Streptomyces sp. NPDC047002]|uniref:Asp23/Gls24 family envelope stress response protein n=1 Tax=Streptomyces sp. NPDC047002 TaxID=3155475 RepID=UPI003453B5A5